MTTEKDVLDYFGAETREECERAVYESTDCGAWIGFDEYRIVLGSIVEGCDFGTATYPLYYDHNFTGADIKARLDAIEAEADALWHWANSELINNYGRSVGKTAMEMGIDAPDVDNDYLHLNPEGRSA